MISKFLLGSIMALFGWAGLAQAQAVLGAPIAPGASLAANSRLIADGVSPAEVAAAKIKIAEAQVQARRAAVKYLGTIDCHYYPEVEFGLISALRTDRAESIRYEAALALGNGHGLTLKMLEALNMTALGVALDGNPAETSERVRIAARMSLYHCACRGLCLPPEAPALFVQDRIAPAMVVPAIYTVPAPQPERELAQTISTRVKAPPTTASRPVYRFLLGLIGRDTPRDSDSNVDPRLRGLILLGSETTVAIPTTPPIFASPRLPYNNE